MLTFNSLLFILTFVGALGSGLMAGLYFAFSVSVMNGLSRLPPAEGITAMQSINVAIINPTFMLAFFGTPVICVFLMISSLSRWQDPGVLYLLVGSAVFIIGSLLVTLVFNIPLNNALASAAPMSTEGADVWANYLKNWTFWNHIRAIASLGASALLMIALYY